MGVVLIIIHRNIIVINTARNIVMTQLRLFRITSTLFLKCVMNEIIRFLYLSRFFNKCYLLIRIKKLDFYEDPKYP